MNTIQTREIILDTENYSQIQEYLSGQKRLPLDRSVIYTAQFDDGYEMDIKCCGGGDETAWTEAVLYKNGHEVCFTDPAEEYIGLWELEADGMTFITNVSVMGTGELPETEESPGSNRWLVGLIYREMLHMLPAEPDSHFWVHGDKIMCDTAKRAEDIADFLNALRGKDEAVTAYYDVNNIRNDGSGEKLLGWHCVWMA